MATHRRFVLRFNALTSIVLLFPACIAQSSRTSTNNGDTVSQSSSGFGYELLRSQLDEMQASILQLQKTPEHRNECDGLNDNIATILNRLETIENGLKASSRPPPSTESRETVSFNEDRLQHIISNIMNARQRNMQNVERFRPRMRNSRIHETSTEPSIHDKVYDSCDDVPSSGVWKIRYGFEISNVNCIKF